MATTKVRAAISASPSKLCSLSSVTLPSGNDWKILLVKAEQLGPNLREAVWELFDENMRDLSSSASFGYQQSSKQAELFDPEGRYLLLLSSKVDLTAVDKAEQSSNSSSYTSSSLKTKLLGGKNKGKGKTKAIGEIVDISDPSELMGYCSFRFDTEETLTSRDAEVIYCYELQLRASTRGQGFGKVLMDLYEAIGRGTGMEKAMLTCLKNNVSAMGFYTKQGYTPDEIDPTRMDEEDEENEEDGDEGEDDDYDGEEDDGPSESAGADYRILSKDLKGG